MAEALRAELQLDIAQFTQGLTNALNATRTFTTNISNEIANSVNAFNNLTRAMGQAAQSLTSYAQNTAQANINSNNLQAVTQQINTGFAALNNTLRQNTQALNTLANTANNAGNSLNNASQHARRFDGSLVGIIKSSLAFSLVYQGIALIEQGIVGIFTAANELTRLQIAFATITGGSRTASVELQNLQAIANKTGQDFFTLAQKSVTFTAATQAVGLSQTQANKAIETASILAQRFGQDSESGAKIVEAFSHILAQQTVTAGGLAQQLASVLPNGLQLAAKAFDIPIEKLAEMKDKTELSSVVILRLIEDAKKMPKDMEPPILQTTALFTSMWNNIKVGAAETGKWIEEKLSAGLRGFANQAKLIKDYWAPGGAASTNNVVSGPYADIFTRAGQAQNIPPNFLSAMASVESGFDPKALSPKGAQGIMQLMPRTAQFLGVPQDKVNDPETNIQAGARYMRIILDGLNREFSTLTDHDKALLAFASFNAGPKTIKDLLRDYQKSGGDLSTDTAYAGIVSELPQETQRYVQRINFKLSGAAGPSLAPRGTSLGGSAATQDNTDAQIAAEHLKALIALRDELIKKINEQNNIEQIQAKGGVEIEGVAQKELTERMQIYQKIVGIISQYPDLMGKNAVETQKVLNLTGGLVQQAQARVEAEREEERMAQRRIVLTDELAVREAALADPFEKEKEKLKQFADEAKQVGLDQNVIDQYVADRTVQINSEKTATLLQQEIDRLGEIHDLKQQDLKEDQEAANILKSLSADTTKSRVDNERLRVDKAIEQLQRLNRSEEEIAKAELLGDQAVNRIRQEEADKLAKEAAKPLKDLADGIENTLAHAFQNVISGTKGFLDELKSLFIKAISELAAYAVTHAIVIPALVSLAGAVGIGGALSGGGSGGADGTSGESGGSGLFGQAATLAGLGGKLFGGNALIGGLLGTPIGSIGAEYVGAPTAASNLLDSIGLEGASIGDVLGAGGAGIGVGLTSSQIFSSLGLHGIGNSTLSGALGGGTAGFMLGGPIGAGIGAILGAIGGALSGLFGGGRPETQFGNQRFGQIAQVGYDENLGGLNVIQGFQLSTYSHQRMGIDYEDLMAQLNSAYTDLFKQAVDGFKSLSPQVQKNLVNPINAASEEIKKKIEAIGLFKAGDSDQTLQQYLQNLTGTEIPKIFEEAFKPITDAIKKVDPIVKKFNDIIDVLNKDIDTLKKQQQTFDEGIQNQITSLSQVFYTSEQKFNADTALMQQYLASFANANPVDRVKLSGQIGQLSGTLLGEARGNFVYNPNAAQPIAEGLFTPAQTFVARQKDLQDLMKQFSSANPQQQGALATQITQMAQQLFSTAKGQDVLGQDPSALRSLQQELIADVQQVQQGANQSLAAYQQQVINQLQGVQVSMDQTFQDMVGALQTQVDLANKQIDILVNSLSDLNSVDGVVKESLAMLGQINTTLGGPLNINNNDAVTLAQTALLGGINDTAVKQLNILTSIDSKIGAGGAAAPPAAIPDTGGSASFQVGGYVMTNTFAYLHAGERVMTRHDTAQTSGSPISITINSNGGDVDVLARRVITEIERRGGRLHSSKIQVSR